MAASLQSDQRREKPDTILGTSADEKEHSMRAWALGVFVVLVVSTTGEAHAEEWYVDQAASSGGDGSESAPFQTINDVRAVLQTGDTCWIRDGIYQETVDFWHVDDGGGGRTSIRAAAGHNPIIDGGGTSNYIFQAGETHDMTFEGLTFRNSQGSAINFYYADGGEVLNCTTESSVRRAIEFYFSSRGYVFQSDLHGGVSGKGSEGTVLEANRIHHSQAEGITLHDNSHGCQYLNNIVHDNHSVNIYIDSAWDMVVDGNLVFTTGDPEAELAGIQLADERYDDVTEPVLRNITVTNNVIVNTYFGIVFWEGNFPGQSGMRNVLIANNTVVDATRGGIVWDEGPHQDTVVRNNIFACHTGAVFLLNAKSTEGVTIDHNLWLHTSESEPFFWGSQRTDHDGWLSASGQGEGDVLEDPGFVGSWGDHDAASYELSEGSPAIDSGNDVPGLTVDFNRSLRPFGDGYDIGAFEYGAPENPDGGPPDPPDGGPSNDSGPSSPDGDVPADGDVSGDGGAGNDSGGTPDSGPGTDTGDSGCSCQTVSPRGELFSALIACALGMLWFLSRRL